jgi:predicted aminopeptidase
VMRRDAVSRTDLDRLITEVRERLVAVHASARTRDKSANSKRRQFPGRKSALQSDPSV